MLLEVWEATSPAVSLSQSRRLESLATNLSLGYYDSYAKHRDYLQHHYCSRKDGVRG